QILAQKGNLLAFASPNAPTGILESKEILCEIVSKFDGLVLVDEAYIDFASPNSSMISEIKNFSNLIVSRTFSKSYSLAGLRVGFLVSQKQNIDLLLKMKDSYNLGMLEQAIAKTAIEDVEYFQTNIQKIINSREKLKQELENLDFEVLESSANFLFAKPPHPFRAESIFTQLRDSNIYVRYFTQERCKDFLRITIGTESENEIFLSSLKSILK
ncbi:MAG: aminotransferase class I/II-fold pyridoxal phosphate-dependent enzyme, partial [Leptospiraceae bacterium]|nr:aminotransferase class I/II-fold pyridoxal phosphate-dependent enzyme [Leptospiraceae bacterium]